LLQQKFKINVVSVDVVHAATSQQRTVDGPPLHEDWTTGRSVHNNIIPTKTAATYALGKVIPELEGRVM
jgi:glyceraldehyde 3-phosphate dehydrogenase